MLMWLACYFPANGLVLAVINAAERQLNVPTAEMKSVSTATAAQKGKWTFGAISIMTVCHFVKTVSSFLMSPQK